jgi:hypothetical protein
MNLARHAALLWRFRAVTIGGIFLGLVLALLATYQVGPDGLKRRGISVYSSTSTIRVTQAGFPEGRSVFPNTTTTTTDGTVIEPPKNELGFADPGRFPNLAELYAQWATSDAVRERMPSHPAPGQITAIAVPNASGSAILPIIQFTATAPTAAAAQELNKEAANALRGLIKDEADANDVPSNQRVELPTLNAPSPGFLLSGPSSTAAILALLLCLIGTVAVTHLLGAIGDRRKAVADDDQLATDGFIVPWPVENGGSARERDRQREPRGERVT